MARLAFQILGRLSHLLDAGPPRRRRLSHAHRDSCTHATRELRPVGQRTRVTPRRPPGRGVFYGLIAGHRTRRREGHDGAGRTGKRISHGRTEPRHVPRGGRCHRHLRHPGRRHPPGLRPPDGLHADPPHPGPPRAGRRARRPGLRRRHRPGGRLHGDLRPRRDQPRHAAGRRPHGLGADGGRDRAGRRRDDRHRRLPGGRHPRHHDADHQAQLPGHRPRRHPAHDRRGLPHRLDRPSGPGARRRGQVGTAGADDVRLARRAAPARLPAGDDAALQADQGGRPADPRGPAPGALRRRRCHPRPRVARAGAAGRADRHPGRHHADGPRGVPRQPPAAPRHAGHARHRRRGRRPAEERPDHQPRRPLRRPGDRQPRLLRPGRAGHPRRHRPGRDRQEPPRRRADRRRLQGGHRAARRAAAGRGRRRRLRGVGGLPGRA